MARYTAQTHFNSLGRVETRNIIPDAGTSVTVEYYSGDEWVPDSGSPITGPDAISCRGLAVRLTPDVGGFFIDEGIY